MSQLRKKILLLAVAVALSVVGASTASAQVPCTVAAAYAPGTLVPLGSGAFPNNITTGGIAPTLAGGNFGSPIPGAIPIPRVRAEGAAEQLGAIIISCSTTSAIPNSTISVTLAGVNFSPASAGPNNTSTFPNPLLAAVPGGLLSPTTSVSGSTAAFGAITPSGAPTTYTISGLRGNIAAAGLTDGTIAATVTLSGGLTGGPFIVAIARVVRGLNQTNAFVWPSSGALSSIPNNFPSCAPPRTTPAGTPATALTTDPAFVAVGNANSAVGFSQADLVVDIRDNVNNPITGVNDQLSMTYRPRLDPSSAVNPPSVTYNTEDYGGITGPGVDNFFGSADDILGGAVQGTRFLITLTGIPSGISVYTPRSLPANAAVFPGAGAFGTTAIMERVLSPNADGSGGTLGTPVARQLDLITPVSGTVRIVYEWVAVQAGGGSGANLFAQNINIILTGVSPIATGTISAALDIAPNGPPTTSAARPQFQGGRAARTVADVAPCATFLLFPFVTSTLDGAFDTGIAVANTTADPPALGSPGQSGSVTLYFFRNTGASNPTPVTLAANLTAGQMATFVASSLGSPFIGYAIAVCGFAGAHGFAFINNPTPGTGGAFAESYVAITLPKPRFPTAGVPATFTESGGH